jgi:hypothetical protein
MTSPTILKYDKHRPIRPTRMALEKPLYRALDFFDMTGRG